MFSIFVIERFHYQLN
ncbi:TPA: ErmCL family antibiotic resistance leader peptide [Streptococcus agalactiae]